MLAVFSPPTPLSPAVNIRDCHSLVLPPLLYVLFSPIRIITRLVNSCNTSNSCNIFVKRSLLYVILVPVTYFVPCTAVTCRLPHETNTLLLMAIYTNSCVIKYQKNVSRNGNELCSTGSQGRVEARTLIMSLLCWILAWPKQAVKRLSSSNRTTLQSSQNTSIPLDNITLLLAPLFTFIFLFQINSNNNVLQRRIQLARSRCSLVIVTCREQGWLVFDLTVPWQPANVVVGYAIT